MKIIMIVIAMLVLPACAMGGLKKDWQERGYTEADIKEIHKYEDGYLEMASHGTAYSSAFDSSPKIEANNRLRNIFCSCYKKLGDKCRQNPEALKGDDRVSWAKANAAEEAMRTVASVASLGMSTAGNSIDTAECN